MPELKMPANLPDPIINENAKIVLQRRYQRKDTEGIVYETVKELFWRVGFGHCQGRGQVREVHHQARQAGPGFL